MTVSLPVIAALAAGFRAGGVTVCANHPGFYSQHLAAALECKVTSRSERAAMAFGWGASLAGSRTVVAMKNVGLNDAADAFVNSLFVGCHGGLVVVVFDDIEIEQSQLPLDSRHFASLPGAIWIEPRSVVDAGDWAARSFDLSERFGSPVVLRVTNALCHATAPKRQWTSSARSHLAFSRDPHRWVVHPGNVSWLSELQQNRVARIQEWSDAEPVAGTVVRAGETLTLCVGAVGDWEPGEGNWLAIDRLPLPAAVLAAALRASRVMVREHGSGYVANMLAALMTGGRVEALPFTMPELARAYHSRDWYEPLYGPLRNLPERILIGDVGSHTMDPHRTIDACLCYGASVAVAAGAASVALDRRVICVTGDGAFAHSGAAGLAEAVDRGVSLVVFVIENGGCRDTGGQRVSLDWPRAASALRVVRRTYDHEHPCCGAEVDDWLNAGGTTLVRCRFRNVGGEEATVREADSEHLD